jgi:putative membrane protein
MLLRWLFASLHLLGLGLGLGAVWARSRALREPLDRAGLRRVFAADAWWGVAAAVWLSTGLVRFLLAMEKGTGYYVHNWLFLVKMALFLTVVAMEMAPMRALTRWRAAVRRGERPDTARAEALARTSVLQAGLVVVMVLVATAMARGLGTF